MFWTLRHVVIKLISLSRIFYLYSKEVWWNQDNIPMSSQKLATDSFLKNRFHPSIRLNSTLSAFENIGFNWFLFYCNFLIVRFKTFTGRISLKNCLNQKFVIGSFSEKAFEATQQRNHMKRYQEQILLAFKEILFALLCKFLNDKVKTIF